MASDIDIRLTAVRYAIDAAAKNSFPQPNIIKTADQIEDYIKNGRTAPDGASIDRTMHREETLFKVKHALDQAGLDDAVDEIITAIQNAGILFRERVPDKEG